MSAVKRQYRLRFAEHGEDEITEQTLDFMVHVPGELDDEGDLHRIPVVTSVITHPTNGRTESRPFRAEVIDTDGELTAALTSEGRWRVIGRLLDTQHRPLDHAGDPAGDWVTYGTGRSSALNEQDGPGKFDLDISDESWKARRARIFTVADTTQIWPHGIRAAWRGWAVRPFIGAPAVKAQGTLVESSGSVHRLRLVAGGDPDRQPGMRPLESLIEWLQEDLVDEGDREVGGSVEEGNFRHLRLNYAGTDSEVVSFAADGGPLLLDSIRQAREEGQGERVVAPSTDKTVTITAWVYSESTPPASGDAFLHAVDAAPSEMLPLHVGLADADHTWGSEGGWLHPATLTRIFWEETGQRFDADALTALEADTSFPALAFRITETPPDPDAWFQDHVWGPCMLAALTDSQGRRKLVDMRLPQDLDPDALPVIDASNARAHTHKLGGREAVTLIRWRYLRTYQHGMGGGIVPAFVSVEKLEQAGLDGIWSEEAETEPVTADETTLAAVGRRPLELSLLGALEPGDEHALRGLGIVRDGVGSLFRDATAVTTRDLLDIFQDGAWTGRIQVGRTLAETLEGGSLARLDCDSLKISNPATGARTGERIVRVMSLSRHPAHAEIEYLDLGPKLVALSAPNISVAQNATNLDRLNVTITDVPAGATATLEVAYADSDAAPGNWPERRAELPNGTYIFAHVPASGWAHARVKATAPGRIRSAWATDSVELATRAKIEAAEVTLEDGVPTVDIEQEGTAGVRLRWAVVSFGEDIEWSDTEDHAVGAFPLEFPAVSVPAGLLFAVELTPWTGFSGGSVTGDAGQVVRASALRPRDPFATDFLVASIEHEAGSFSRVRVDAVPGPQAVGPFQGRISWRRIGPGRLPGVGDFFSVPGSWVPTPFIRAVPVGFGETFEVKAEVRDVGRDGKEGQPTSIHVTPRVQTPPVPLRPGGGWVSPSGSGTGGVPGRDSFLSGPGRSPDGSEDRWLPDGRMGSGIRFLGSGQPVNTVDGAEPNPARLGNINISPVVEGSTVESTVTWQPDPKISNPVHTVDVVVERVPWPSGGSAIVVGQETVTSPASTTSVLITDASGTGSDAYRAVITLRGGNADATYQTGFVPAIS